MTNSQQVNQNNCDSTGSLYPPQKMGQTIRRLEPPVAIDKLDFILPHHVEVEKIGERLRGSGLTVTVGKTQYSRNHALKIGPRDFGINIILQRHDSRSINVVKTNPNSSGSLLSYWSLLRQCFSRNELESAEVFRFDCAVDIQETFDKISSGIIAKYKQGSRRYLQRGSNRTGTYFGNVPEEILIYDKGARLKDKEMTRTRVEVRLSRAKKPINYIHQIPNLLSLGNDGEPFRPFKNINILDIDFHPYESFENKRDVYRCGYVRGLFDEAGYQIARKRLNTNQNFDRDYKNKFMDIEQYPIDLDLKFSASLERFCRSWDNIYLNWSQEALRQFISFESPSAQSTTHNWRINETQLQPL